MGHVKNSFLHILFKNIATLGFIGHIPFAPGTFGSIAALLSSFLFRLSSLHHLLFIFAVTTVGIHASTIAEKHFNSKDSSKIVIDEFAGFYVSIFLIPHSVLHLFLAFLLFRFFDILKPLGIKKLEKALSNGLAVMIDDIIAGIYANIVLQTGIYFLK